MDLTKQDLYILGQSEVQKIEAIGQQVQLDVELEPKTIEITGIVSGLITDGENGIYGAYVKIMDHTYKPISHTITDENGYYKITNLPANATYYAFCTSVGKSMERSSLFSIAPNEMTQIEPIILSDDPKADFSIIAGEIFDAQSKIPISNAIVTLSVILENDIKNTIEFTSSNPHGQFVFRELNCTDQITQYEIHISYLGYFDTDASVSMYGPCQIGFVQIPMNMNPKISNGTISGVISDSTGVISNADVILYTVDEDETETPIAFTTADSNGVYVFFNVEPGTYLVKSNQMSATTINVS